MQSLLPAALPCRRQAIFFQALQVERDLADRHCEAFSLLSITIGSSESTSGTGQQRRADRRRLGRFLQDRLRTTDVLDRAGFQTRLLLRRTDRQGAEKLREDIEAWATAHAVELECAVQVYDGSRKHEPQREGDLDLLMVQPLSCPRRALDIAVAGSLLVLLAPILGLIALAIRIESAGPVFFAQKRIGSGGRPFRFLKFRSMVKGADSMKAELEDQSEKDGPIFKIKQDPRVTHVGRFLRSTSLDEAPQLINVLKGDMTLVGPRPQLPEEVEEYEPWQRRRLEVPSGLTCIWQVSGRSELSFEDWMRLDCRYVKQQSPLLDASLMARTLPAVLSKKGAY